MARLLKHVSVILNIPIGNVYSWTDSRVVLGWLGGDPLGFKVFVGNGVSEILDFIPTNACHHVASRDNSADRASRGLRVYPSQLANHMVWRQGPEWLGLPQTHWPTFDNCSAIDPDDERDMDHIVFKKHADAESRELPLLRRCQVTRASYG